MGTLGGTIRSWWAGITGQQKVAPKTDHVIIHDPAAEQPHDLDDPFFDDTVQSRLGRVIADSVRVEGKGPKEPPKD